MLNQYTATITTTAGGAATVYLGSRIRGRIVAIKYDPGTMDSADLTFTGETSGVAVLTKAGAGTSIVWYYPIAAANKVADATASTISEQDIWLYLERLKLVVAAGGNVLTGTVTLWVDEPVERMGTL